MDNNAISIVDTDVNHQTPIKAILWYIAFGKVIRRNIYLRQRYKCQAAEWYLSKFR